MRRSRGGTATRSELGRSEWKTTRAYVRQRDGNTCRCGSSYRLAVHHIVPARYGGTDDESNLVLLCHHCHSRADKAFRAWLKRR